MTKNIRKKNTEEKGGKDGEKNTEKRGRDKGREGENENKAEYTREDGMD